LPPRTGHLKIPIQEGRYAPLDCHRALDHGRHSGFGHRRFRGRRPAAAGDGPAVDEALHGHVPAEHESHAGLLAPRQLLRPDRLARIQQRDQEDRAVGGVQRRQSAGVDERSARRHTLLLLHDLPRRDERTEGEGVVRRAAEAGREPRTRDPVQRVQLYGCKHVRDVLPHPDLGGLLRGLPRRWIARCWGGLQGRPRLID
jgi:hypothetical protein